MTLDQACGRYWLDHAHRLPSAYTIDYQLKNLCAGIGGDTPLHQMTDARAASYVSSRRIDVSPASVNRELTLLRAVLRMARDRWDVEVRMPTWKAQRLKEAAPRERYLTPTEAQRVLEHAAPHIRPGIELSLLTGIRLSNCVGLDWSEVDLQERHLALRVKGDKPHFVPLCEPAFVLLANLGPKDDGAVFLYRGRAVKEWRKAWKSTLRRSGIEDFRWHDLRHTAASWMVQAGVPLDVVQKVLGHSDISTTMRYAHREDSAVRAAVDAAAAHMRHIPPVADSQAIDDEREVG
jgi:integrase